LEEPWLTAVIAALSALAGVLLSGWLQERNTRVQVMINNRSSAYVLLTDFLVRLRAVALTPAAGAEDMSSLADVLEDDDWYTLQARVLAFGSIGVTAAFDDALTKRAQLRTALHEWNEHRALVKQGGTPPSTDLLDELNARRKETLELIEQFLTVIRNELAVRR
jgi:hypothetical protein